MNSFESIVFWPAELLLAAVFSLGLYCSIFKKTNPLRYLPWLTLLAWVALTILAVGRWVETGHPPFVTRFESIICSVWFALLMYHLLRWRGFRLDALSIPLAAFSFLLLGWGFSMETAASPLSSSLENTWLFIHASFATAGAAAFVLAASLSVVYLRGETRLQQMTTLKEKAPAYASLPGTTLNLVIFGLILWGVMIVSGSIWANAAWGRYWAWDPIEIWSLISWLLYGLLLHSRLTFKVPHRLFSYLTILAALTVLFALWGVHYIYETIHSYG